MWIWLFWSSDIHLDKFPLPFYFRSGPPFRTPPGFLSFTSYSGPGLNVFKIPLSLKVLGSCKLARQSRPISLYFAFLKLGTRPQWYFEIFGSWFFDSLGSSDYMHVFKPENKSECEEKWDLKNADFLYFADFTDGRSPICAIFKF